MSQVSGTTEPTDEQPKSYILIQFQGQTSAIFGIKFENVSPAQAWLAANVLELQAKNAYLVEQERLEQQRLAVPKPQIIHPGR